MPRPTLRRILDEVLAGEPCTGSDEALIAIGLRALLAAIGRSQYYRQHYIAKGGTVLRLLANERLERLSTDLDLSVIDIGAPAASDHEIFATQIGRTATEILREVYDGSADIVVTFDAEQMNAGVGFDDGQDPDTISYGITVSARLKPSGNPTVARGRAYKIDLTCDEYVDQTLINDLRTISYGIPIDVRAYAPIQSISEKLRAILQKRRHFDRTTNDGNWVPRHLLDLMPLRQLVTQVEIEEILPGLFRRKCECRAIPVDGGTRALLLDRRLYEKATGIDRNRLRAQHAWGVLEELTGYLRLPT